MSPEQTYIIALSKAAIFDEDPPLPPEDIDWQYIWDKAYEQNISGLLASAILKLPKDKQPNNAAQWRSIMIQTMVIMSRKNAEFEKMSAKLKENQIDPICLKGCVLKDLYPEPALRVMGDFDVLIEKQQRKQVEEIFRSEGYTTHTATFLTEVDKDNVHGEIFVTLEEEFKADAAYWDDKLRKETFKNDNGKRVLKPIYDLMYVIVHMAKHFMGRGCGIRNFLDIAVLLKSNADEIDFEVLTECCIRCRIDKIYRYTVSVMEKYFDITVPVKTEETKTDIFMEYVLNYGVFGRDLEGQLVVGLLMNDDKGGRLRGIFPSYELLKNDYAYLAKSKLLLPIAWIHRIFRGVFIKRYSFRRVLSGLKRAGEFSNERKDWLKELNIH